MFTGIIQELGTVARVERRSGLIRLHIRAPKLAAKTAPPESVAVNGVCLSVAAIRRSTLTFEVIPETRQVTSLGDLRCGDQVNLESSVSALDRLSGHILLGHVDGTGRVERRRQTAGELVLGIRVSPPLRKFLIPKGPVAVDGVSLTVGRRLTPSSFQVHLIPETLRRTTLRWRQVGDPVNIELDYLAKLVEQFVSRRRSGTSPAGAQTPGHAGHTPGRRRYSSARNGRGSAPARAPGS
jgi:riboflavin synthase